MLPVNHSVNSSSHSVNGDIANPIGNGQTLTTHRIQIYPLTDYDKTLHNWLRPRDEHVRNPKFVPIGRKGAPGKIREI